MTRAARIAVLSLCAVVPLALAAQDDAPLPAGVKAVWDKDKAFSESTATRERVCINGLWRWQPVAKREDQPPASGWGFLKVPGPWPWTRQNMATESQNYFANEQWKGLDLGKADLAWYQREIDVPASWSGRGVIVTAAYVQSFAEVFVDGKNLGSLQYPGGAVDITAGCANSGKHLLSILVIAAPLNAEAVSFSHADISVRSKSTVARRGLCGDVYLESFPHEEHVADVKVNPSVRKWELGLDVALDKLKAGTGYAFKIEVREGEKAIVSATSKAFQDADLKSGRFQFSVPCKPSALWDTNTPQNQLDLVVSLLDSQGKTLDVFRTVRFGFREYWIDGRDLRLNGTRFHASIIPLDSGVKNTYTASYEGAKETFARMRRMGYNFVFTHNYDCSPGSHLGYEEVFRAADDTGMLIALSLPHYWGYDWSAPNAEDKNGYARDCEFYVRQAQNHPSVVLYAMNHNMCGYGDDQNPEHIDGKFAPAPTPGHPDLRSDENGQRALRTEAVVQRFDASRPIYHHSCGNTSQMYTLNCYLDFVPIRERSEWFGHWAREGVKPLFLVEYGDPIDASWTLFRGFYKGKKRHFYGENTTIQYCYPEWGAQFRGDEAYRLTDVETNNLRFEAGQFRNGKESRHWMYPSPCNKGNFDPPNARAVQALYYAQNIPSFRTWGVSGVNPWSYDTFFKTKPGVDPKKRTDFKTDWEHLQRPGFSPDFTLSNDVGNTQPYYDLTRDDWVEIDHGRTFARVNRPVLAYLAGAPAHFTDRDHNFAPDEPVEKQVIVLNDSRATATVQYTITLDGKQIVAGKSKPIQTGEQERIPITFPAPAEPGSHTLKLEAKLENEALDDDTLVLNILPPPPAPKLTGKIALFDPKGETRALLQRLKVDFTPIADVNAEQDLQNFELLLIGKEALAPDGKGLDLARVAAGLNVIVFEQTAAVLEGRLGFRVADYGLRQVFPRVPDHPALMNLKAEDLADWRGASSLPLTELKPNPDPWGYPLTAWCGLQVTRAWRGTRAGSVASVLIEKPARGDFLPLVDGGFGLRYSPLLEHRVGKGLILFCQLDVSGRSESEPATLRLAANLLAYVSAYTPPARREILYVGEPSGRTHLEASGFKVQPYAGGDPGAGKILVVGPGGGKALAPNADAIRGWLAKDGRALALGLAEDELAFLPFPVKTKSDEHIACVFPPHGLNDALAGIGPADVHNRDPHPFPLVVSGAAVLGDGILARSADGRIVLCQIVPWKIDYQKLENTRPTFRHAAFLVNRLLVNLGAEGGTPLETRFAQPPTAGEQRWKDGLYVDAPIDMDDPYRYFRW